LGLSLPLSLGRSSPRLPPLRFGFEPSSPGRLWQSFARAPTSLTSGWMQAMAATRGMTAVKTLARRHPLVNGVTGFGFGVGVFTAQTRLQQTLAGAPTMVSGPFTAAHSPVFPGSTPRTSAHVPGPSRAQAAGGGCLALLQRPASHHLASGDDAGESVCGARGHRKAVEGGLKPSRALQVDVPSLQLAQKALDKSQKPINFRSADMTVVRTTPIVPMEVRNLIPAIPSGPSAGLWPQGVPGSCPHREHP
jgi:hypothetical protein